MRQLAGAAALACLLAAGAARAEEVARIDDVPVLAREIGHAGPATLPAAANALRQRAMKSALQWFIADQKLAATEADIEAYEKWNEEFQRREKARRAQRLEAIEAELDKPGIARERREQLLRERDTYHRVAARDAEREAASRDPGSRQRVWGPWITSFKANKKLTRLEPKLLHFGIGSITGGTDAQGECTVRLEVDGREVLGQGAHSDIIVASAKAFINALNKGMAKVKKNPHQL